MTLGGIIVATQEIEVTRQDDRPGDAPRSCGDRQSGNTCFYDCGTILSQAGWSACEDAIGIRQTGFWLAFPTGLAALGYGFYDLRKGDEFTPTSPTAS